MRITPVFKFATTLAKNFLKDETGQDLLEYALLLVFLALAAIGVLPVLGKAVNNIYLWHGGRLLKLSPSCGYATIRPSECTLVVRSVCCAPFKETAVQETPKR